MTQEINHRQEQKERLSGQKQKEVHAVHLLMKYQVHGSD